MLLCLQEKQVDLLQRSKENVSTPEGVPRLFDLIKVQDERMKLAFYAALGNTVVAKDLDQVDSSFCLIISCVCFVFKQKCMKGRRSCHDVTYYINLFQ